MTSIVHFFKRRNGHQRQRFEALLQPHMPLLYRKAWLWTRSREDAEDLVQDVLVKLAGQVETLERLDNPGPWLVKVLYRQFVDFHRQKCRNPVLNESSLPARGDGAREEGLLEGVADGGDAIANLGLRQELVQAINQLDRDQRISFILREVHGYSLEEAARMLDVNPGTIKTRTHRAKQKLREFLGSGTFS